MSLAELIKQPRSVAESLLDVELLLDLTLKHLYVTGVLDLQELSDKVALTGSVMDSILTQLRNTSRIEVLGPKEQQTGVRFKLTDLGRIEAEKAFLRSGYVGRAPITIEHYRRLVVEQSIFNGSVTREQLKEVFKDVVMPEQLYDQLGPALHSGRAILIYGQPGTGKTFICKHLARCLGEPIHLPYAISVGREIIQFFDPLIHVPVYRVEEKADFQFKARLDQRLILCERPVAISGGELTLDILELNYDPSTRLNQAPIQLKANNGIYIIDDMGRQSMPPMKLLNRWIVPMEEHLDYLTVGTGQHFPVPFDTVLIFSTNLNPLDLADEAFLRRLGYKIRFTSILKSQYAQIWLSVCEQRNAQVEDGVLDYVFELYDETRRAFLPCQPRDLIGIALDIAAFREHKGYLSKANIKLAWDTYFIELMKG